MAEPNQLSEEFLAGMNAGIQQMQQQLESESITRDLPAGFLEQQREYRQTYPNAILPANAVKNLQQRLLANQNEIQSQAQARFQQIMQAQQKRLEDAALAKRGVDSFEDLNPEQEALVIQESQPSADFREGAMMTAVQQVDQTRAAEQQRLMEEEGYSQERAAREVPTTAQVQAASQTLASPQGKAAETLAAQEQQAANERGFNWQDVSMREQVESQADAIDARTRRKFDLARKAAMGDEEAMGEFERGLNMIEDPESRRFTEQIAAAAGYIPGQGAMTDEQIELMREQAGSDIERLNRFLRTPIGEGEEINPDVATGADGGAAAGGQTGGTQGGQAGGGEGYLSPAQPGDSQRTFPTPDNPLSIPGFLATGEEMFRSGRDTAEGALENTIGGIKSFFTGERFEDAKPDLFPQYERPASPTTPAQNPEQQYPSSFFSQFAETPGNNQVDNFSSDIIERENMTPAQREAWRNSVIKEQRRKEAAKERSQFAEETAQSQGYDNFASWVQGMNR